jgi:hypothetical protein
MHAARTGGCENLEGTTVDKGIVGDDNMCRDTTLPHVLAIIINM